MEQNLIVDTPWIMSYQIMYVLLQTVLNILFVMNKTFNSPFLML